MHVDERGSRRHVMGLRDGTANFAKQPYSIMQAISGAKAVSRRHPQCSSESLTRAERALVARERSGPVSQVC
jgi:hypothetical protein